MQYLVKFEKIIAGPFKITRIRRRGGASVPFRVPLTPAPVIRVHIIRSTGLTPVPNPRVNRYPFYLAGYLNYYDKILRLKSFMAKP